MGSWVRESIVDHLRLAAFAALAAALALAGCGRKAGLDPPPSSSVVEPQQMTGQPSLGEMPSEPYLRGLAPAQPAPEKPAARPAPAQQQSFFLDWLLK